MSKYYIIYSIFILFSDINIRKNLIDNDIKLYYDKKYIFLSIYNSIYLFIALIKFIYIINEGVRDV